MMLVLLDAKVTEALSQGPVLSLYAISSQIWGLTQTLPMAKRVHDCLVTKAHFKYLLRPRSFCNDCRLSVGFLSICDEGVPLRPLSPNLGYTSLTASIARIFPSWVEEAWKKGSLSFLCSLEHTWERTTCYLYQGWL